MIETLHKGSDPICTDGRDIDTSVAELSGEASQQNTFPRDPTLASQAQPWTQLPVPQPDDPTYYDRAMLKDPVWRPYIPLYYYIGGAAGASLALGAAAQFDGSRELDLLVRRCHWIGIIGSSIGGMLLILDLGRKERFLHMMRVFRPTSPMNMGAWILAGAPPAAITAGLFARRPGIFEYVGEIAGYTSGLFGLGLATYTGVLLSNTAIPVWQESRHVLPILFGASAVASSAAIFDILFEHERACRITRKYGIIGRCAELSAGFAMEKRAAAADPRVARPLKAGVSGALWKTATALTAASLVTLLLPNQNRKKRVIAGVLGTLGSLALRFAVHNAGIASARDPRASFRLQRAGAGAAAVAPRGSLNPPDDARSSQSPAEFEPRNAPRNPAHSARDI